MEQTKSNSPILRNLKCGRVIADSAFPFLTQKRWAPDLQKELKKRHATFRFYSLFVVHGVHF